MLTHTCPAPTKHARTAPSAATSTSTSSATYIGFLPPSSRVDRHEPLPRLRGDDPTGARRPGEAHVVDVLDHRRADRRPVADDHLQEPVGKPGLLQQLGGPQRREGRLRVRPQDHGVAGDERRQHVAERERQREVPGRDDADDADRVPQHADAWSGRGSARARGGARGTGRHARRSAARRWRCRRPPRTPRPAPCRTPAG